MSRLLENKTHEVFSAVFTVFSSKLLEKKKNHGLAICGHFFTVFNFILRKKYHIFPSPGC